GREGRFVTGHDPDAEGGGAAALFVGAALGLSLAAEQGESIGREQIHVGVRVGQHIRDRPEVVQLPHRRRGEAGKQGEREQVEGRGRPPFSFRGRRKGPHCMGDPPPVKVQRAVRVWTQRCPSARTWGSGGGRFPCRIPAAGVVGGSGRDGTHLAFGQRRQLRFQPGSGERSWFRCCRSSSSCSPLLPARRPPPPKKSSVSASRSHAGGCGARHGSGSSARSPWTRTTRKRSTTWESRWSSRANSRRRARCSTAPSSSSRETCTSSRTTICSARPMTSAIARENRAALPLRLRLQPRRLPRLHSFGLTALLALGGTGCATVVEVPVETPVQSKIDVSRFRRVLVAGFVTDLGENDVELGSETSRLLQNQLRSNSRLQVLEPDHPPLQ